MTDKELLQKNVEEFSRLQSYMKLCEKDSEVYQAMRIRYVELKVILTASGVNLNELDVIKEQVSRFFHNPPIFLPQIFRILLTVKEIKQMQTEIKK